MKHLPFARKKLDLQSIGNFSRNISLDGKYILAREAKVGTSPSALGVALPLKASARMSPDCSSPSTSPGLDIAASSDPDRSAVISSPCLLNDT